MSRVRRLRPRYLLCGGSMRSKRSDSAHLASKLLRAGSFLWRIPTRFRDSRCVRLFQMRLRRRADFLPGNRERAHAGMYSRASRRVKDCIY
jgi:hypothetical protein